MAEQLQFDVECQPDFALLNVKIPDSTSLYAEPSAMATMSKNIQLKASLKGGIGGALKRMVSGENLIMTTLTAQNGEGEVALAPATTGDIFHYRLKGTNELYLQRGAFLAHGEGVEIGAKWGGAKGFFSGKGLILLKATGEGDLFFNCYGSIIEVPVDGEHIIDTNYVVAFESSLDYNVTVLPGLRRGGKIKSFLFGGEGLVTRYSGQGKLWIQTRAVSPFVNWVHPFRPVKSKSD